MYYVHTRSCFHIFVCIWYIHIHECKYMYGHSTDTSVQLHNHTSFPIRPDQPCDAGESQLRAGASPSEQPPSCHQSFQLTDHPGVACHVQTATATGLPHTHCCHACHQLHCIYMYIQCIYMYIRCTWVPRIVCMYHYGICQCVLACTAFEIGMYYAIVQELLILNR